MYCSALAKLPWQEVVENRGLSFDSMRDIFLHLTIVEDRWVSYTLVGRFLEWKDPLFKDFGNMESLKEYMNQVHDNTKNFLKTLKTEDHKRTVANPWVEGTSISTETGLPIWCWSACSILENCPQHFGR